MKPGEPEGASCTKPEREPVLIYDPHAGHWVGTNASFSVWMDDATFRAYAASWYEWPTWLPDLPQEERFAAAVSYCRRLCYWNGCERNYDRRVHITYH